MASDILTIKRWLAISPGGSTSITVNQPRLEASSIAILLEINVPKAIFRKPQLRAVVNIPAEAGAPAEIDASVTEDMVDAVRQATGLTLQINVVQPSTAESTP